MPTLSSAKRRKRCSRLFSLAVMCAVLGLLWPSTVWAHKVNVFAYVEGDTVVTESYFNDGRKCRDSTIEVFDEGGRKLLEGKTDTEGTFSFHAPVRANLLIRLTASMGHRAEYTVQASELPGGVPEDTAVRTAPEAPSAGVPEEPAAEPAETTKQAAPAMADIERAIDRALARQLPPIRRAIEESKDRQRFSDIVGGIGYIIGLMGLALYFRSRQLQRRQ